MKKLLMILSASAILLAAGALAAAPMISVNQFVEHPALDSVLKGLQDYLKDNGVDAEFKIHNAQANIVSGSTCGAECSSNATFRTLT